MNYKIAKVAEAFATSSLSQKTSASQKCNNLPDLITRPFPYNIFPLAVLRKDILSSTVKTFFSESVTDTPA